MVTQTSQLYRTHTIYLYVLINSYYLCYQDKTLKNIFIFVPEF